MNQWIISIIKIIIIFLLLVCLTDRAYEYFQVMRTICMISFAAFAFMSYISERNFFTFIWIFMAIIINPFIKIHFGREIWNIVDVIFAIIVLVSIFKDRE